MKRKLPVPSLVCAVWTLICSFGAESWGDKSTVPEIIVPPGAEAVRVDGRLDDAVWKSAAKLKLLDNQTGKSPSEKTTVRLIRIGDYLCIGFDCRDRAIFATLTGRDNDLWKEEAIEVFFDPAGDGKEYLEIEINPIGTLYDAWVHYSDNIDFDGAKAFDLKHIQVATEILGGKNSRSVRGWTCEIAIPMSELPMATEKARINLTRIDRVDKKRVYYHAWSPTYRWFHVPERFGKIIFLNTSPTF